MKLAVVRVRGVRKLNPRIKKTLELLGLERPNHCVLVEDSPQYKGMLAVVKDYVAYGPIDEETLYKLLYKRGKSGSRRLQKTLKEEEIKNAAKAIFSGKKTAEYTNPVFRLSPPSKGYKNIKRSYPEGDLGKREDMNSLLKKMM